MRAAIVTEFQACFAQKAHTVLTDEFCLEVLVPEPTSEVTPFTRVENNYACAGLGSGLGNSTR
jgi:hypothetical protein